MVLQQCINSKLGRIHSNSFEFWNFEFQPSNSIAEFGRIWLPSTNSIKFDHQNWKFVFFWWLIFTKLGHLKAIFGQNRSFFVIFSYYFGQYPSFYSIFELDRDRIIRIRPWTDFFGQIRPSILVEFEFKPQIWPRIWISNSTF